LGVKLKLYVQQLGIHQGSTLFACLLVCIYKLVEEGQQPNLEGVLGLNQTGKVNVVVARIDCKLTGLFEVRHWLCREFVSKFSNSGLEQFAGHIGGLRLGKEHVDSLGVHALITQNTYSRFFSHCV